MLDIRFFFFRLFIIFCLNTKFYSSQKVEEYKIRIISYGDIENELQEKLNGVLECLKAFVGNFSFNYCQANDEDAFKNNISENFFAFNIILKRKDDEFLSNLSNEELYKIIKQIYPIIAPTESINAFEKTPKKLISFYFVYIDWQDTKINNDYLSDNSLNSVLKCLYRERYDFYQKNEYGQVFIDNYTAEIREEGLAPFLKSFIQEKIVINKNYKETCCHCC